MGFGIVWIWVQILPLPFISNVTLENYFSEPQLPPPSNELILPISWGSNGIRHIKLSALRDFPGGPVVRTPSFHCRGHGLLPGLGAKIQNAAGRG